MAQDLQGSDDTDVLADLSLLLDEDTTDESDNDAVKSQLPGKLIACHFLFHFWGSKEVSDNVTVLTIQLKAVYYHNAAQRYWHSYVCQVTTPPSTCKFVLPSKHTVGHTFYLCGLIIVTWSLCLYSLVTREHSIVQANSESMIPDSKVVTRSASHCFMIRKTWLHDWTRSWQFVWMTRWSLCTGPMLRWEI